MFAVVEHFDAVLRVTGRVGGDEDRFDILVFHELFERGVGCFAFTYFCEGGASVGKEIAYGDDFDIGVVLKAEGGGEFTYTISYESYAYFTIGNRCPYFIFLGGRIGFIEALDLFIVGRSELAEADQAGSDERFLHK